MAFFHRQLFPIRKASCLINRINFWLSKLLQYIAACTWWRHQMEIFFALQVICAGNSPVTGEFPAQRPVTRSFDVFFDLRLNEGWVNNREAGDLRRHRARYDVTILACYYLWCPIALGWHLPWPWGQLSFKYRKDKWDCYTYDIQPRWFVHTSAHKSSWKPPMEYFRWPSGHMKIWCTEAYSWCSVHYVFYILGTCHLTGE